MELKYSLIEGNDAVSRAILMMKYNLTKTLTENIISEQSDYLIDKRGNAMLNAAGIRSDKDYKYVDKFLDDATLDEYSKRLYDWLKTFNAHDWLAVIEVSSGIAAMVSGPFAPIFLGIGAAAGAYDSYLYFKDGDPYMGTIMMALSLIPGGVIKGIFKTSKVLQRRGIKGSIDLIKKYKSGSKLTKEQAKDLSRIGIDFAKNSSQINAAMGKEVSKRLLSGLAKKSPKFLMNLILALNKIGLVNLSEFVLKFGGTIYTFDKIYLYVFRDSVFANQKYLDSRTKNEHRAIVNKLLKYDKEVNEYLLSTASNKLIEMSKNGVKLAEVNVDEQSDVYLNKAIENLRKQSNTKTPSKSLKTLIPAIAPTLDDIISGKRVIKKGQKGDSVIEIQKMLYSIGYGDFVSRGGDLVKWDDGIYGDSTELAIKVFQDYEGLESDGIVGVETLNKLMTKYKENNNE
jgi:hypothetical protein